MFEEENCRKCGEEYEFSYTHNEMHHKYDMVVYCECCGPELDTRNGVSWPEGLCRNCSEETFF